MNLGKLSKEIFNLDSQELQLIMNIIFLNQKISKAIEYINKSLKKKYSPELDKLKEILNLDKD